MATALSSHYQASTNGTSATSSSLQSTNSQQSPKLNSGVQGGSILKNRLAKSSTSALDVALGTDTAHRLHATGAGSHMKKTRKPSYPQSKTFPADLSPLSRMNQHRNVLEKYRQSAPSLVLHIHPTHFRFEQQDGVFLFSSPLKSILEHIRNQKLPADLMDVFDETKIKFYDGCIIVEIRDHRPRNNVAVANAPKPETNGADQSDPNTAVEIRRVALKPTAESIWSDLCLLNESHGGRFSQEVALELESKILLCTAPPLCLEPNIRVSRIGNAIVRSQYATSAAAVDARKRKRNVGKNSKEMEEDAVKQAEAEKIMAMFSEKNTEFLPSFSRMSYVQDWRRKRKRADAEPAPTLDPKKIKGNKTAKKQAIQEQAMLSDGRRILRTIKFEREEGLRKGETEKRKVYTTLILYQDGKDKYESVFRAGSSPDTSVDGLTFRQIHKTELEGDAHLDHLRKLLEINNKFEIDIRSTEGPPIPKPVGINLNPQQQQAQTAHLQQAAIRAAAVAAAAAAGGANNLQGHAGAIAAQMARQASVGLAASHPQANMSMAGSPLAVNATIPLQQPGTVGHSANAMAAAAAQMANLNNGNQQSMLNSPDLRLLQKQLQQQAHAQAQAQQGTTRNNQMSPQQQQAQLRMQALQQQNSAAAVAAAAAAAASSPQMNRASPQQQPLGLQGVSAAAMIAQMPLLMQQAQNPQQVAQLRTMLQHLQRQQLAQQQQRQQLQAQAVAAALAAGGQQQAASNVQGSPSVQSRPSPAAQQAQIQQLLQAQAAQQRHQVVAAQAAQQNNLHQQHQANQISPQQQQQQRQGGLSMQNLAAAGISPQILFAAQQRGINLNNLNLSQLQQLSQLSQISNNNQNANGQNQQAALAAAAAAAAAGVQGNPSPSASAAAVTAMSPAHSDSMRTPSSPAMPQGTSAAALAAAAAAAIKNNAGTHTNGAWSQQGHQQAAAALALQAQSHQVQAQANAQYQADAHAKAQAQIQALQVAIQRGTVSPELLQRLQLAQNTATLRAQQAARAKAQAEAQSMSLAAAQAAASAQATRQGTGTPK